MADPTPYSVGYSFAGFQASSPTTPLPGSSLDAELAGAAAAIAELISALTDVRRADGALVNGIVTMDSLESGLAMTVDPTNGELVAAAVATSAANAALTDIDRIAAAASAAAAAIDAAAAEAAAASVNLTLYLPKAGNLADLGSNATARANLGVPSLSGDELTGRLAAVAGFTVTDWNTVLESGWSAGENAANAPAAGLPIWIVQTIAYNSLWVTQIAYPFTEASVSNAAVTPYRRHSYDNAGVIAWRPWESMSPIPVGEVSFFPATTAPAGYLKANGALVSRATYPRLYAFAAASSNIVAEASWAANAGGFSTGDLSTTFRLPDLRGEFIRGWDDARGVDSGRTIGSTQADSLKDHTHSYQNNNAGTTLGNIGAGGSASNATTGSPSTGAAAETRPRNVALLACIKY